MKLELKKRYKFRKDFGKYYFWEGSKISHCEWICSYIPINDQNAYLHQILYPERFHRNLIEIYDEYAIRTCDYILGDIVEIREAKVPFYESPEYFIILDNVELA